MAYCAVWAAIWLVLLFLDILNSQSGFRWIFYLSNWSFLLTVTSSILQLFCAYHHSERIKDFDIIYLRLPLLYKINWVVFNCAITTSVLVSIMFWSVIYDGSSKFNSTLRF